MTNNLIFKDGSSYAICGQPKTNVPSMHGNGWRMWHIEATIKDVAVSLDKGLSHREYESIARVGDDGNYVTEVLTEDLSEYVVFGGVYDHLDGAVTIWVRKETELEKALMENAEQAHDLEVVSRAAAKADLSGEDELILDMPTKHCAAWVIGANLKAGNLVSHDGIKYLVMQNVTAAEHQPPNMPNGAMLAVYKPYQGRYAYNWVYGEYCEAGFTRYENGVLYRAKSDPGANIYPPSQVPAVWEVE